MSDGRFDVEPEDATARDRPTRPLRYSTTGDPGIDRTITQLLTDLDPPDDRDLLREIFVSGVLLAQVDTDRLDLKIVSAALREMRDAFTAFAPYRGRRKVTVFGSARTTADHPLYTHARDLAAKFAASGWMIVTGAGPGIMLAAMEGAGRENSFGVRIRLPFEVGANEVIDGDPKLVSMKYFFTRKLMLMKESAAFVSLPGGFGTLDEMFELLTLQQTGKAEPAPLVLLDVPGGSYWHAWRNFATEEVEALGCISPGDVDLATITDSVDEAHRVVEHFFANFHSQRWVGNTLVLRMRHGPNDAELADFNVRFSSLVLGEDPIVRAEPLRAEIRDDDHLDLARLLIHLNPLKISGVHGLIGAINDLPAPSI